MNWITALIGACIAFAVTAAIAPRFIRFLQKMKFGQKILEIGPSWHMNKQYTPTMGGFIFMIGITASLFVMAVVWNFYPMPLTGASGGFGSVLLSVFAVWLLAMAYGLVGFVDDWAKIKKKQNAGLTPMQKLLLQIVVAAVFLAILRIGGQLNTGANGGVELLIPGTSVGLELPWVVYLILSIFIIVGCDNAVNLTDGIDGLAAGVTLPVALFFVATALRQGNPTAFFFASALAGGLIGFLIYNFNPAKVFMGDTGSLFLGGAVAGLAYACDMPLILVPVGIIYILETLSVIIQVTGFKVLHGKRIFKMAPIHHHFELCGWSEKKIVFVASGITAVMCVLAWLLTA